MEVTRLLVMVEDNLLVKFAQFRHTQIRLRKNFNHLLNCLRKHVDFFPGVVEGKRSARGCRNLESLHDWLRAMMSSTHSNPLLVENGADVMRMNLVEHEREHARFLMRSANYSDAFYSRKLFCRITQQVGLVLGG